MHGSVSRTVRISVQYQQAVFLREKKHLYSVVLGYFSAAERSLHCAIAVSPLSDTGARHEIHIKILRPIQSTAVREDEVEL